MIDNAHTPPVGEVVARDDYLELEVANAELRRQVRHQQLALAELGQRFDEVTQVRAQLRDDTTRIVVGTVVGGAAAPPRETLTITPGALRGVSSGQWVVATRPIDPGETATGRELVLRGWVIGQIADARNHLATVRLCSDPAFGPLEVAVARFTRSGEYEIADGSCVLEGAGGSRMVIQQASQDYQQAGFDQVLVKLAGPIPVVMTVGQVVASRVRTDSPLHFDLEVAPMERPQGLTHVFVLVAEKPN